MLRNFINDPWSIKAKIAKKVNFTPGLKKKGLAFKASASPFSLFSSAAEFSPVSL
jgi:hypothetical protein